MKGLEIADKKNGKKMLFIGIISLFLLIPLFFINGIVSDRAKLYNETVESIGNEWGGYQVIGGPVLVLKTPERIEKNSDDEYKLESRNLIILPENLNVKVNLKNELRKRGIYEASVYTTTVEMNGNFKNIETKLKNMEQSNIVVGISDINSLVSIEEFEIAGEKIKLDSGTGIDKISALEKGLSGKVDKKYLEKDKVSFKIKFEIRGSKGISLLPFGEENNFQVVSAWKTPKFTGMLPTDKKITNSGFDANWNISYLTRSYKQEFYEDEFTGDIRDGNANVDLYNKLTHYGKIERAGKYGALFIFLTMGVVYIFEILNKKTTYYIQYIVVGVSLTLFYLVLVSLAERISFELSYLIAMLMVIIPNSLYIGSITKTFKYGIFMFGFLVTIYTMLFSILRMEEFALLTGTVLVMTILYIVMYLTRNLDKGSFGE